MKIKLHTYKAYPYSQELIDRFKSPDNMLKHARCGKDTRGMFFVNRRDRDLVGYIAFEGDTVIALEVAGKYEGKGYAKRLLKIAEACGADKLSVNKKNEHAIEVYKHLGYRKYDSDDAMIYMRKEVSEMLMLTEASQKGVIVYRGTDENRNPERNVWVTDSQEYAAYWAEKDYNEHGVVKKFFLPARVIKDLCNAATFEELMEENGAWQEIPEDSAIWEEGDDAEHDLMHDLCYPSERQISILKDEGYRGLLFRYDETCFSILVFNGKDLKAL